MKKCKKCGFPFILSKLIRWNENGTITMLKNPNQRAVIIEADFLTRLFSNIEDHLGISISHLVFEAQRNASVHTIDSQLSKFPYKSGRWGSLNKRITVNIFCRLAVWLGQSYAEAITYRPGKGGEAIVRNPYNRELMAAIILGAFESLERKPFQHTWKRVGDEDIVSITVSEERPDFSSRLDLEYPELRQGDLFIPQCPSCGMPRELAYLEWREDEGIIIDNRRDERVVFLDGYVPTIVFRELEKELGKAIYPIIIQAEKESALRRIEQLRLADERSGVLPRKERDSIYEYALAALPQRGQGNPVRYKYDYLGLEVTVDNPYNEHLLAGSIAALFEAVEGHESEVEWESPQTSRIIFTVRPKQQPKS